jgi:hypothetical protein
MRSRCFLRFARVRHSAGAWVKTLRRRSRRHERRAGRSANERSATTTPPGRYWRTANGHRKLSLQNEWAILKNSCYMYFTHFGQTNPIGPRHPRQDPRSANPFSGRLIPCSGVGKICATQKHRPFSDASMYQARKSKEHSADRRAHLVSTGSI